jgi:hypothetical protein
MSDTRLSEVNALNFRGFAGFLRIESGFTARAIFDDLNVSTEYIVSFQSGGHTVFSNSPTSSLLSLLRNLFIIL